MLETVTLVRFQQQASFKVVRIPASSDLLVQPIRAALSLI